jgi:diguanylate cyclase (GGDEF)-like protein
MNFSIAALFLLPYFLSKYVCAAYKVEAKEKIFCNTAILFPLAYVIGGILQVLGLIQYTDLLLYAGLALVLFLLGFCLVTFIDFCKGNRALGSFLLSVLVLLVSVMAEEILLFLGILLPNAVLLHLGMTISGGILLWHSARSIKESSFSQMKERMLLDMAFTDSLTGLKNRSAYEKRIEEIIDTKTKSEVIGILLMDVNNLKDINDTCGHLEGDKVLKEFSRNIEKLVPSRSEIFRIGGDEFVCFIPKTTEDHLQELADEIERTRFSRIYSVAVGYSIFIPKKKEKISNIIHKADLAMYACKIRMKQEKTVRNTIH